MPSKQREQQHHPAPGQAGRGCALKIVSCSMETDCTKHLVFNHFGIFPSHDLLYAQPLHASLLYFSVFEINLSYVFNPLSLGHSPCCFSSSLVFFPLSSSSFCLVLCRAPSPMSAYGSLGVGSAAVEQSGSWGHTGAGSSCSGLLSRHVLLRCSHSTFPAFYQRGDAVTGLFIISLLGMVSSQLLPSIFEEEMFAVLSAPGRKVSYKGNRANGSFFLSKSNTAL